MATDDSKARDDARQAAEGSPMDRLLARLMDRTGGSIGVQTSFGEPIERGELTVVPVARVRWFFGGGGGSGPTPTSANEGAAEGMSTGTGAGGGAGVTPIGVMGSRPSSGATFKPIADAYPSPLFIVACAAAAAFVIRALGTPAARLTGRRPNCAGHHASGDVVPPAVGPIPRAAAPRSPAREQPSRAAPSCRPGTPGGRAGADSDARRWSGQVFAPDDRAANEDHEGDSLRQQRTPHRRPPPVDGQAECEDPGRQIMGASTHPRRAVSFHGQTSWKDSGIRYSNPDSTSAPTPVTTSAITMGRDMRGSPSAGPGSRPPVVHHARMTSGGAMT